MYSSLCENVIASISSSSAFFMSMNGNRKIFVPINKKIYIAILPIVCKLIITNRVEMAGIEPASN